MRWHFQSSSCVLISYWIFGLETLMIFPLLLELNNFINVCLEVSHFLVNFSQLFRCPFNIFKPSVTWGMTLVYEFKYLNIIAFFFFSASDCIRYFSKLFTLYFWFVSFFTLIFMVVCLTFFSVFYYVFYCNLFHSVYYCLIIYLSYGGDYVLLFQPILFQSIIFQLILNL